MLETRIQLDISGKGREITVGRALLAGLIPMELASPLPAILAQDGSLKVQARAGSWSITFTARHPGAVKAFALLPAEGLVAAEEVWVFQAAPLIRSASIEGAPTVDPQQTTLPKEWHNLPAYLMRENSSLSFKEIRRGDSDPAPDKLNLERRLWLSFDGTSMTMSDRIQGEINRATRLVLGGAGQLGRADIAAQDQLITRGSDQLAGIEVKRGNLVMSADSMLPGAPHSLSAVGWKHDFDHLSIELALPAGWRLLHAGGVDRADGAWLSRWNLLDFFLVLVIALAAAKLWGRTWGVIALLALVLSYQEPDAPRYAWLVLLAAVALLRVLPSGRFKDWMRWLQRASLLALVLITLGFATEQVRGALYPVLEQGQGLSFDEERDSRYAAAPAADMPADKPAPPATMPVETQIVEEVAPPAMAPAPLMLKSESRSESFVSKNVKSKADTSTLRQRNYQNPYQSIDPDAKVQTGPGLPNWRWHSYRLSWDGPVHQTQQLDLWLLSPWANKILVVVRLLLLALFLACIADVPPRFMRPRRRDDKRGDDGDDKGGGANGLAHKLAANVALVLLALAATLHVEPAQAQLPDQDHLNELKAKLTRPADCLPECAEISRLSVQLSGSTLRLGLEVDAAIETALPWPGGAKHWLPHEARIDGKVAYIQRNGQGDLWLLTPAGRHRVELNGNLIARDTLQLPLPRKPRRVDISADGWDVAGLSDDSDAEDTLQFTRRIKAGSSTEAPVLPPFLRVERRLILDLVWRVETTVRRASPLGVPALIQIPLLQGEAVTSAGVNVKDGKVLVNLGPQADSLSWSSTLAQRADLTLLAPKESAWVETWVIASSTIWHITANGIAPVAMDAGQDADLAFQPWPGETLTLKIERPQGIAGQTVTIDQSRLLITPGTRATDYQLSMRLRSSRGLDHTLTLPEGADLQRVSINGQPRAIRASGRQLVLPLLPGKQNIDILWRTDLGMKMSYSSQTVGLNLASVNSRVELQLPHDRWLLLTNGPGIGPAILFWGKLFVLLAVAFALGRYQSLPVKTRHWLLLMLGLTQVAWFATVVVIAWFFAFSSRSKSGSAPKARWVFNLRQLALAALTLALFSVLFEAVQGGLLGQPEMQVTGNNSSYNHLIWYLDRAGTELQSAWVFTLPMLAYRALMLVWALWLAWSLLSWLKWGWGAFGTESLWRRKLKAEVITTAATEATSEAQQDVEK